MNEAAFRRAVCKLLPADVHQQGMAAGPFSTAGTPDKYFDYKRDLWIEFKLADHHGNRGYNVGGDGSCMLTDLQKRWLRRRWKTGGNACVIVGVPSNRARGFVLETPEEWESVVSKDLFIPRLKYAPELAHYILTRVS